MVDSCIPKNARTCIGDICGFRMFYKDGLFSIFATTNFDANSTRTLIFSTTGGCKYKDRPMVGFGVTLTRTKEALAARRAA